MANCRSCGASVIWAETAMGKAMPLDETPTPTGNMVLITGKTRAVNDEDRELKRETYTSHFATCPDAAQHRRPRT
jgi:hypothetical protein